MDKEYFRRYYQKNRERRLAQAKQYQQDHREERVEYSRKYYQENKDKWEGRTQEQRDRYNANRRRKYAEDPEYREKCMRESREFWGANPDKKLNQRMRKYGITANDYHRILEEQGGGCAICGVKNSGDRKESRLHVDHCHDTGKVRGVLCSNCNLGIGKFKHDSEILIKAAMYLRASLGEEDSD